MSNFYFSFLNHPGLFGKNNSCASSPPHGRKCDKTNLGFALLFVSFLLSTGFGFAQSSANYAFATNATSSLGLDANGNVIDLSVGATPLVAAASDQGVSPITSIGFNFVFFGNNFSQFSVSANGILQLGSTAVSGSTYVASGGNTSAPKFSAIGSDAITASLADGGGIVSKVVGTAPNRCLVVQWVSYLYWLNSTAPATFQVRLYESTGVVEYVYGQMPIGASTYSSNFSSGFSAGTLANQLASITTSTNTVSYTAFTTNAYAAASNIPNLHSTTEGSRRNYSFTPPSNILGDASNLAFTAVLANGLTVNWEDSATNESGFVVTRATDAAFTQNVTSFSVVSTTSGTTGTPYSLVQTGIGAGTVFYYKVIAIVEAAQSTGVTGNVSTLAGATYYWTGTTGENWNTFANWNTAADGTGTAPTVWDNSDVYVIDGAGTIAGGALSIVVDRASFTAGQVKIVSNTNLTLASSATATRTITISGGPSDDFVLEAGSSLNLTSAANAIAFAFSGSGNTGLIAGTYIANGSTSNVITTTGGTTTLMVVASTGSVTSSINSSSAALVGSISTLRFENGSNYNHAASTTVNYIPTATWLPNATATLNGNTTGTGMTSGSTSLGNLVINTTLSTATFSAFTSNSRIIQGNLTINNTGTGKFRAVTSGLLQINGNLIINGGVFEVGSTTGGGVIVKGNTTVASGAVLDLNQSILQNEGNMVNNGAVLSSETTTTSSLNFLGTASAQTLSGTGTFTGRVSSLGVSNPLGLTISTPVLTQRVNLFSGTITGSSNITIGTGLALAGVVQIGSATNTTSGGNFDVSPVFNLGTGTYSLLYLGETTPRTTGFEVPASRNVNNLTVNNANGLTIAGGTIEVVNGLTLTNGIVTSTLANHIIHGSATAVGTLTGGSATSYISGPIVRTIANANTAFVLFPVGKSQYTPVSLAPTTTEVSRMRAEAYDANAGTANASIINLSANRRWETALVSGAFNDIKVRLADASLVSTNIPVQAPSAAGTYTSAFGSTATFTAGTPNVIESGMALTAANFTGFLSFADSNACSGTPAPGNTIASSNAICFGSSVNLSLQTIPIGSGITYQWKSSTDGVTYAEIVGATSSTLTVTPMVATYYLAEVTCSAGPATGSSTAVQITFGNNVVSTTPATRCGLGTVNLNATGSASSTVRWYANATGGSALASGTSFTTPTIDETTTYFAAAEQTANGTTNIGAGLLTSSNVGISFLSGGWGGVKTQYIIRASELVAAGIAPGAITSLGFEPTTAGQTYTGFSVSMGATSQNAMTTAFISAGLSQVYLGTLANDGFLPVANTVNNLAFGTGTGSASSFVWDGTSNIVVSISRSSVPNASTSTGSIMKYDATGFTSTAYDQADNLTPAAMLASVTADATTANRPRFMINGVLVCSSPRVPVVATVTAPPALTLSTTSTAICNGATSTAITVTSNAADYDTYIWSPAAGVSGNSTSGWIFNPTTTTTYTLTASQSAGNLCAETTTITVTVNPVPTAIAFTPAAPTVCTESVQALTANGGTIPLSGSTSIGTATTLTAPNNLDPTAFNNRYKHYWLQMVFTQAELTAAGVQAGNVNGIKFQIATIGSAANVTDFRVRLGSTAVNTMTGFIPTGLTEVYTAPVYTHAIGVNAIVFSTPYVWDGISNIIVDIRSTGVDTTNNAETFFTATTDNKTISAVTSTTFASSNAYAASNPTGTLSLKRLNTTFDWTSSLQNAITWTPATNLYSDAAGTVAYVAGTPATTVYFKSNTVGTVNYTATATSTLNCSVNASVSVNVVDCGIPYANLQFPGVATIGTCVSPTYYARVYKQGVTEAAGQGAGIQAWIGKHTANTDPATWPESSWQLATFNVQSGNDDEYQATFAPSAAGTYYVASRFVFAPGNFVYGGYTPGGGGIWNGTSNVNGVLTVEATTAPIASAQTFCNSGTVADLVATGTALQWYTASTGGTALDAATALATGDYYVSQTVNSCEGPRTMVSVTLNVTAAPTASAQTFCNSGTVADLVATGTALQWYAGLTGGTALDAATALASGDYYVSQTLNACESPRTMVAVTLNVTAAPTASAQSFCNAATVADLVATGTALQWYAGSTGGTALASTTALASGNYYVSQTLNACESPRTMAAITVSPLPNLVITNPSATCGATVDLTNAAIVSGSDAGLTYTYWADPFGMVTFPNPNAITGSGTYYIKATNASDCFVISPVIVTINVTAAPTGVATQDFTTGQTLADFTVVGQNIIWYSSATGSTVLPSTTVLVSGVIYYASQTVNGCESVTRLAVTAGVDLKTPGFEIRNLRYYPNPVQDILTVDYSETIENVQMYNMLGQMVYNRNTNASKVTIEMTNMPAGNYILQVTVSGITKNVKVIKK